MPFTRIPIQPGAYFVTLATAPEVPPLSRLQEDGVSLTVWGEAVREAWFRTAELRPYVRLDPAELVIMPNHLHGVIWVFGEALPEARASVAPVLQGVMRTTARRFQRLLGHAATPIWQLPPFEHPIRDAFVLHAVRTFIRLNPSRWGVDVYNPLRRGEDELAQELMAIFRASL